MKLRKRWIVKILVGLLLVVLAGWWKPLGRWVAAIPATGDYSVYVSYASSPLSATDARDAVRAKKLDEAYTQWGQELRARAYVEYREPPQ